MNKQLTAEERAKLHQGILQALDSMPAQLRRAFVLNRYQNLSSQELGEQMNLRPEQANILLQSADSSFSHHLRSRIRTLPIEVTDGVGACCCN